MPQVVILGPAYPLRGGLASFDERLSRAFQQDGWNSTIYTFSLQYPSFLFPGTSQYSEEPKPEDLNIRVCINSVNPFNWIKNGISLYKLKPDLVIVRFWLPFMGPCLGTILRILKTNKKSKIICIADNVIPHEKRIGDKLFTAYFLKASDAFITMSDSVNADLKKFRPDAISRTVDHPLYDNFGESISRDEARNKLKIDPGEKVVLFFGFIRKYKGLDLLLDAFGTAELKNSPIKLLVAGEFYEDPNPYLNQIEKRDLVKKIYLHTHFIPDSEIKNYFSAADLIVQPYKHATQSGVTPLAYHFEKPMVVTDVGGLAKLVPNGIAGIVCKAEAQELAVAILHFFKLDQNTFKEGIATMKKKLSWSNFINHIKSLANDIPK